MPFKNEAQRRAMWANAPGVAERWEKKYGKPKKTGSKKRARPSAPRKRRK